MVQAIIVGAVDWGGTWIRTAMASPAGDVLAQHRDPRPVGGTPDEHLALIRARLRDLSQETGLTPAAVGVAIAGIVRDGTVESALNAGITEPYPLAVRLRQGSGRAAVVANDTQAAAIAEAGMLGPGGADGATTVLLTVGTGVGGAIVAGGQLVSGDGAAGDFGHLVLDVTGPACPCGARGCLEQLVSGRVLSGVARDLAASGASPWLAARAAPGRELHAGDLDAAARAGDVAALTALGHAADVFALALRSVVAAVDPRAIVLGGGLMAPGTLLPELVQQRWPGLRPRWSRATVSLAVLGPAAELRGAAILAGRLASQQHVTR